MIIATIKPPRFQGNQIVLPVEASGLLRNGEIQEEAFTIELTPAQFRNLVGTDGWTSTAMKTRVSAILTGRYPGMASSQIIVAAQNMFLLT